jgi:hypothetical protein
MSNCIPALALIDTGAFSIKKQFALNLQSTDTIVDDTTTSSS